MRERRANVIVVAFLLSWFASSVCADEKLRDPTRPDVAGERTVVASRGFVVNAIIASSERRIAIVNGQRVRAGDSLDGATVISIGKSQLILEKDGKRLTIKLQSRASRQ